MKGAGRTALTDDKGYFIIKGLNPGKYTVRVSYVGLKTQEKSVNVSTGETATVKFTLDESSSELDEVVVTNTATVNKKTSLGKSTISGFDLPQSSAVISNQVIRDQQAVRLGDVLKNVAGVSLTQTRQGVAETFSARGYSIGIAGSGGSIFKNGMISNTQGFPDASTLESIEVLKGSSALLYGNVSGGVIINMVTKKPRFDAGGEVSMLVGSYNQFKPTFDVYGPMGDKLAFRLIGTHEEANSYRDVVHTNRSYINPSLLYKISKKTEILVQGDFLQSNIVPDAGVGVPNKGIDVVIPENTPRNRFINAVWAYNNTKQVSGSFNLKHQFNEGWRLDVIGSAQTTKVKGFGVGVPNSIEANGDYTRTLSAVNSSEDDYAAQINLNGEFKTGSVKHQLLLGNDFTRIVSGSNTFKYTSSTGVVGTAYDKINIFDFNKFVARTDIPNVENLVFTESPQNRYGAYIQDLISLSSKIKVLAGLRWSTQKAFQTNILTYATGQSVKGSAAKVDQAFSPKAALIYQPVSTVSIYGSYTNSFNTNSGTDIYGNNIKPSIVDQYEFGLKNEFLDGRISANLSVYRIKNSNLAQTALFDKNGAANTDTNIKELSGETTSDGLDLDINGSISKNFYFIAGYGYNFMRYTNTSGKKGSNIEGERLINNPKHTANASIFYTFTEALKGLKLGASAFYTGVRSGGLNNTYQDDNGGRASFSNLVPLTGFVTADFSIGYTYKKVSLLTKVSNIFDEMNYIAHDRYSINPIAPRQFVGTLSYKF